jgi:mannan endo-1,4-beta-mannosidase
MIVVASIDRAGRHRRVLRGGLRPAIRRHRARFAAVTAALSALTAIVLAFVTMGVGSARHGTHLPHRGIPVGLRTTPESYLGVYTEGTPLSYSGVTAFTKATGVRPRLVVYYSGWWEPFQTSFAITAAEHGAVPLVQIDPTNISLAAITSGRYDAYLTSYAQAVREYRKPVILSFGHEMNGLWFSWGYRYTSPAVFVAAWRHIVTLFRSIGTPNVTWLWTVNIIKTRNGQIPSPAPWWPGSSYVNWVGIDGYYLKSSWQFVPMFGPTIAAVRELTSDPILISETSAIPGADQPKKIPDLFAGIHTYGLLGFVWFNVVASHDYRINDPAAIAAFRQGAKTYGHSGL